MMFHVGRLFARPFILWDNVGIPTRIFRCNIHSTILFAFHGWLSSCCASTTCKDNLERLCSLPLIYLVLRSRAWSPPINSQVSNRNRKPPNIPHPANPRTYPIPPAGRRRNHGTPDRTSNGTYSYGPLRNPPLYLINKASLLCPLVGYHSLLLRCP